MAVMAHVCRPLCRLTLQVTITTVGYGDLSPKTTEGKMCLCLFILLAVIVVPMRINTVVEHLGLRSPYAGKYTAAQNRKHVVVTGLFDRKCVVRGQGLHACVGVQECLGAQQEWPKCCDHARTGLCVPLCLRQVIATAAII